METTYFRGDRTHVGHRTMLDRAFKNIKNQHKILFFYKNTIVEIKLLLTKFHLFLTKTLGVIEVRKKR
jgi:hypothetical protein